jgi:hypothetical protein
MMLCTIVAGVSTASRKDVGLNPLNLNGKLLDIRKNPPAIDVGLDPSMRLNS